MSHTIPLSLYIHIPWCVRKCPYCDFNSHTLKIAPDESAYIAHLLRDFQYDYDGRTIQSIFIGGGTPSLFSGKSIETLLNALQKQANIAPDAEITLEANPGTVEQEKFSAYQAAGVNRLSLGIQSFNPKHLQSLGRIHNDEEAHKAIETAQKVGFSRINIDLMFALPQQTPEQAISDLKKAIAYQLEHISWYQLTLEPNTPFYTQPPAIPDEDDKQRIYETGAAFLREQGYQQYETSAWTSNQPSKHNLNYWQYGDYIGIGAGAHGKLTTREGKIIRNRKYRSPVTYQSAQSHSTNPYQDAQEIIPKSEQAFEFMMNALRLKNGVPRLLLSERTAIQEKEIAETLNKLIQRKLLIDDKQYFRTTELGFAFLNDVISEFLPTE
ncbi:radical SAM family heme chaperone HemW [Suttonella ornithocola]|uniref:Heme chaperone HemW n=1 Tax=Suttonella ornithocola TaxID=279832 RepID=A0A380MX28_9GAMM|nr:radical SAM family heme chaperone HemW [Suttonella ornithocola]SUO97135.1 Oxygen-independent coproporphyrinogen-III oxidase [Suttonella ornithocola]